MQSPACPATWHLQAVVMRVQRRTRAVAAWLPPGLTVVTPVQVAAMRVQEQAFSSVTVGETEKVDLTDAHKAPVTANGMAAGASTSGLPTPISEDTSRSHVAHGATGGHWLWPFMTGMFRQAVCSAAWGAREGDEG